MARTTKDARVGKRVEIAPHYDLWMRGARFGTIRAIDKQDGKEDILCIRMDNPSVKRLARILASEVDYR